MALENPALFGLKASGLASLPQDWTPRYFAVGVDALTLCVDQRELEQKIEAAITGLLLCPDGVIVRSSATAETLNQRGALESRRCAANATAVIEAMKEIAADAPISRPGRLAFVIQRWLQGASGHLSNERRVSGDRRSWTWEVEDPSLQEESFSFRADSSAAGLPGMECLEFKDLQGTLRWVARELSTRGRAHVEWLWDGRRVWLVQIDDDTTQPGPPPGSAWTSRIEQPIPPSLSIFQDAITAEEGFPKFNHVKLFDRLGLSHGDVRLLADGNAIQGLAAGDVSQAVRDDLAVLAAGPVVVRTDVRGATTKPEMLSRRTDTCTSADELAAFLKETAAEFIAAGKNAEDLAFLVHRFLLGKAGAFSYAEPGSTRVLIDATWGIPDSLLFYPHDSFRVQVERSEVQRYLRCKTDFIDVDARGRWQARPAGTPWDWKPSLTNDEAIAIAQRSLQIAESVDKAIDIMFFVIDTPDVAARVIPWFYHESGRGKSEIEAARGFYVGEKVLINDADDLARLEAMLGAEAEPRRLTIRLRPGASLLRDRAFIQAVGAVALEHSLPVELEGSQLSHIYYLLDDAGVGVRCLNPWRAPEKRRTFGKLVRDLIPVRIERGGERATTYVASRKELGGLVRAKMVEEALEFYWASGGSDALEEMADLLELLRAAARTQDVSFEEVEAAADKKRAERGGFEGGVVLLETREGSATPRPSEPAESALGLSETGQRGRVGRRVVRLPGRRLQLPLVPPVGWIREQAVVVALDGELEVVISYGGDTVRLQVRPRNPRLLDEGQLVLPGLDESAATPSAGGG